MGRGPKNMGKYVLSEPIYENLLQQLVSIEEQKEQQINNFLCTSPRERDECIQILKKYLNCLDQILRTAERNNTAQDEMPFVTVDSYVQLYDYETATIDEFRVISPFNEQVEFNDISFLSPLGKELLMKKVDEEVIVKAPGGTFRYRIESIRM
ncbi:MAG TPA: transcription elongation factor GreAB [Firmicutes bacterium]|nr:transcription elongation factor GreAB [Bacillota bacterium]HAZ22167.1 transcription elongation factor GreAB [Bacillota bacterium]HBL50565.1 transcription elongation factor GreAB [Bacillota bacterium]HBR23527.1 transcription elongation factor GreAB [Bacillota bacterium]HCF88520.1 transcription elongation factor GreAB [Bacillota bacterium]